jgi:hypothetical protein
MARKTKKAKVPPSSGFMLDVYENERSHVARYILRGPVEAIKLVEHETKQGNLTVLRSPVDLDLAEGGQWAFDNRYAGRC